MTRDFNTEATNVFAETAAEAYRVAINEGKGHAEAESFAIGVGRDAEDAFWAKAEAEFAEVPEDVHTEHCCKAHGCKYGKDAECTVMLGRRAQSFPCEVCGDDTDED